MATRAEIRAFVEDRENVDIQEVVDGLNCAGSREVRCEISRVLQGMGWEARTARKNGRVSRRFFRHGWLAYTMT